MNVNQIAARLQNHSGRSTMASITIKKGEKQYFFTTRQFGKLVIHADDENPDIYWYEVKDVSFRADLVTSIESWGEILDVRILIEMKD